MTKIQRPIVEKYAESNAGHRVRVEFRLPLRPIKKKETRLRNEFSRAMDSQCYIHSVLKKCTVVLWFSQREKG